MLNWPFPGNTPHAFLRVPFSNSGNRNYFENFKQERIWFLRLGLFQNHQKGLRIQFQTGPLEIIPRNGELIHHGSYSSETVTVAIEAKSHYPANYFLCSENWRMDRPICDQD